MICSFPLWVSVPAKSPSNVPRRDKKSRKASWHLLPSEETPVFMIKCIEPRPFRHWLSYLAARSLATLKVKANLQMLPKYRSGVKRVNHVRTCGILIFLLTGASHNSLLPDTTPKVPIPFRKVDHFIEKKRPTVCFVDDSAKISKNRPRWLWKLPNVNPTQTAGRP